ncbi:xylosylprotein 4-beta-galactosyltransferase-like [Planococcus citri]|uniref:xylosylprotein 4-beta-galactosyltransferase-like n=1 Tax=Planococcus citri TaxID=170843 RepID=UPI0031F91AB5
MSGLKLLVVRNFLRRKTKTCALCFTVFVILIVYFLFFKLETPFLIGRKSQEHVLCVLVPFRNTFEELLEFIPHMNDFLNRQKIKFYFIVVNHRFSIQAFNAGFEIITKQYPECDYVALHDIDLLPLNDEIPYTYPGDDLYNVANPEYHPRGDKYDPARYVGGISLISNKQYIRAGGFGNHFWGWGGEDRNFFYRISNNSINRVRPTNLTTDKYNTFRDIHSPYRFRDFIKCGNQKGADLVDYDLYESGFHNVNYGLLYAESLTILGIPFTLFGITVPCNFTETPWCKPFCRNT